MPTPGLSGRFVGLGVPPPQTTQEGRTTLDNGKRDDGCCGAAAGPLAGGAVPLQPGINQLLRFGGMPVQFGGLLTHHAMKPDGGPGWGVQLRTENIPPFLTCPLNQPMLQCWLSSRLARDGLNLACRNNRVACHVNN
jgi:hypothetical protein